MLDVHPPHHPATTWRDFFIHIATIVIGLIIAVALEQTVEHLHNRHIRHDLQAQLLDDARRNVSESEKGDAGIGVFRAWLQQRAEQVYASLNGETYPDPRPPRPGNADLPAHATWEAAKASGEVAVLPGGDIKAMTECDASLKSSVESFSDFTASLSKTVEFEWDIAGPGKPIASVTSLTLAEKQQYLKLLMTALRSASTARGLERSFRGCEIGFIQGERELSKLYIAERQFQGQP